MTARNNSFDEQAVLHELRHYLPALSPGSAFTFRNPLQAFQDRNFHEALRQASAMLGYHTMLSLEEYRSFYNSKRVNPGVLEKVLVEKKGAANTFEWQDKVLMKKFPADATPRIGKMRAKWQKQYKTDLNARVHPRLFRILGSCLDHGISDWKFPVRGQGFLDSMREVELYSLVSAFNTPRARNLLLHTSLSMCDLLTILVGDEALFKQYLFDQQFAHSGWSGLVATLEASTNSLPNQSRITLRELIVFELLLEIDVLDDRLGTNWQPLGTRLDAHDGDLFAPATVSEKSEVLAIWQEAVEWSYYEEVLGGLNQDLQSAPDQASVHYAPFAHAPDSICMIGRPSLAWNIAPGHRVFLSRYDFSDDSNGETLEKVLETVVPSLGAANLEYFFSRTGLTGNDADHILTDQRIGLSRVDDRTPGDLRTGLPTKMAEGFEPMRLLCVVEQHHETVLKVISRLRMAHSWLMNEWVHLVVVDPDSRMLRVFRNGEMLHYRPDRLPPDRLPPDRRPPERRPPDRRLVLEKAVH